jgi:dolichol kinase
MSNNLIILGTLSTAFLIVFGTAEWLYRKRNIEVEYTRKLVHSLTGLITLSFPLLLENHLEVLFLCSSFLMILLASKKFKFLESVNAVKRKTHGSLLFPVAVYTCFVFQNLADNYLVYYLPILILAVSDPVAALVGKRFPIGRYTFRGHTKTLAGSLGFFVSAFLISYMGLELFSYFGRQEVVYHSAIIAALSCLTEAISKDGLDNITTTSFSAMYLLTLNYPLLC